MSTRVKVAIVLVLVALIIGLIVYDSTRSNKNQTAQANEQPSPSETFDTNSQNPAPTQPVTPPAATTPEQPVARTPDPVGGSGQDQFIQKTPEQPQTPQTPEPAMGNKTDKPIDKHPDTTARDSQKTPSPGEPITHVVQKGDIFEKLAEKYYSDKTKWKLIQDANPTKKSNKLKIGDTVTIPPLPKSEPKKSDEFTRTPDELAKPSGDSEFPKEYEVKPRDSLYKISQTAYHNPKHFHKIYEANKDRIKDPNSLVVGTKLTLPKIKD